MRRRPPQTKPFLAPGILALLCALLFASANLAPALRADGIVIPPVAAPPVTMPDQRALLVWHEKEQTETLVIESRFTGNGHDFAWVVPLPSKPDITPATRGTLPTLAAQFRLKLAEAWDYAPFLIAVFAPWALCVIFAGRDQGRLFRKHGWVLIAPAVVIVVASPKFIISVAGIALAWLLSKDSTKGLIPSLLRALLLAAVVVMILLPLLFGTLAAGGPDLLATTDVEVERSIVGDYEVVVLAGGDDSEITQWLRTNRFALPAAAEPVVAEHARAGGFFAAVKLRRTNDNAQPTAAAPLVFTFKTPKPVYPMKLTGAGAARPLEVELFVFGDARAEVDGLTVRSCERTELGWDEARDNSRDAYLDRPSANYVALSHPALRELCVGTSVATRLTGTLAPSQMTRDLTIRWQPFTETVAPVRLSANDAAWLAMLAATALLTLAAITLGWRFRAEGPPLRISVGVVLAAAALGGGVWLALPIVPVMDGYEASLAMKREKEMSLLFKETASNALPGTLTEDSLRKVFQPALTAYARSHGIEVPRESDSPGNYVFRPLPGGHWRLVWFDDNGSEMFWSDSDP